MKKTSFILAAVLAVLSFNVYGCKTDASTGDTDGKNQIPEKSNYKVEYYFQNILDDEYTIDKKQSKNLSGKTDSTTNVRAKKVEGFTSKNIEQQKITADGEAVVKIYYDRNIYTFDFDSNGGSAIEPISLKYGADVTKPADPTKTGYRFLGWSHIFPETMPAEDITFIAAWLESTSTPYKVEHYLQNVDDDEYTLKDTVDSFGTTNNDTKAIEKAYEGFTALSFDQEKIAADGSTVVKIKYDRNEYKINFNSDGGSEIEPISFKYGAAITAPANPTKAGYTFDKWNSSIPETMPANNLEIKALWKVNVYTITYKDQYDEDFSGYAQSLTINTHTYGTATTLPIAVKYKHLFLGWYLDSDCENTKIQELGATDFTDDITLYAKWTDTISVTLSMDEIDSFLASTDTSLILDLHITDLTPDLSELKNLLHENLQQIAFSLDLSACTGLTSIDAEGFKDCMNLNSIILPNTITSIGEQAFDSCMSLTSFVIPYGVTSIENNTFNYCIKLTSVTIPSSVTFIDEYAFVACSNLASITIPSSVTSIGQYAFYVCSSLTSLTFEDTTTWYQINSKTDWDNKTGGTQTDVSTPETNATNFTSTSSYYDYYWYKLD